MVRPPFAVPLFAACLIAAASTASARPVSREQRLDAVRRAVVWRAVPVETMDTLNGPPGADSYTLGQEVRCRYEERDPLRPIGGHSPKFPCHDASGTRLKVKYGEANPEVYGEVAATRLFWALGFFAERMYSVKVVCDNCPEDPFVSSATPRATRAFEPATIQRKLKGEELSEAQDEGWTFDELDLVDPARGGSTRAEVDALKLLAAFVNHGDNTANQQRLLCSIEDEGCAHPLMYVTDLGGTFGGRTYATSFRHWAKKKSLWKDPKACILDFTGTHSGYKDPRISEAGRKLLADLLSRLSDKQVRQIFEGARFGRLGKHEPPLPGAGGKGRPVSIDDWVQAFKDKRRQILDLRCPE